MTVEEIASLYQRVQPARGDAWFVETLCPGRLFATRSSDGSFGLFVAGSKDSFGQLPRSSAISHADDVRIEPIGTTSPMLRFVAPDRAQGSRAMIYLACEATRQLEADSGLQNEDLVRRIVWLLVLLEDDSVVLTPESQRGLIGELHLLARLVRRAKTLGLSSMRALERWHGPDYSKRDFSGPGIAVEVKTSAEASRVHSISSLTQLDPQQEGEEVFVYSLGVRHDYSAPRRLEHFIQDVEVMLQPLELDAFRLQLKGYGYDPDRPEVYQTEAGLLPFHLQPRFFASSALDRLRAESFVGGAPPAAVLGISYRLLVTGVPHPVEGEDEILDRMLALILTVEAP